MNNKTSTPRTGNASVNLTSHSSIKPGINKPSPSVTGASATKSTPKSPAVDSTKKKIGSNQASITNQNRNLILIKRSGKITCKTLLVTEAAQPTGEE